MMKKLLSLVCCLSPMGAGADVVEPETAQNPVSVEQIAGWSR